MLKYPVMIGFSTFEVTDRKREIPRFNGSSFTFTPHPHNASGRRAHILPIAPTHGILVDLPQVRLGRPGQLCQRLRVDFGAHDSPNLHRR